MRVKCNFPLSDTELRRIETIFKDAKDPDAMLSDMYPNVFHKIDGDVLLFGSPPWDLAQEIHVELEV